MSFTHPCEWIGADGPKQGKIPKQNFAKTF